ncbi:MAG: InlB B-repeat-containing protein, partial [Saccharofermentanales bacterium]
MKHLSKSILSLILSLTIIILSLIFAAQNVSAEPYFTVTFRDWNGTDLKTEQVDYGLNAIAPDDPFRTGYTFVGWDVGYTNITADLIVTAVYDINVFTVTFKDWDGIELKTENVNYGADATAPANPT